MSRQRRFPLLLNPEFPPEKALLDAAKAFPDGDRAALLRLLALLGDGALARERQEAQAALQALSQGSAVAPAGG